MITKQKTLKLIKEKVDAKTNGKIKLKKMVNTNMVCGIFKHIEPKRIKELFKRGNSVYVVDDNYEAHNLNELDTNALHRIMWQIISDKEKKDIALKHLLETKAYLKN